MRVTIFDVDHGQCALVQSRDANQRIALIDCGHNVATGWRPSAYVRQILRRSNVDYLIITNADQDHLSDLPNLRALGVSALYRNRSITPEQLRALKRAGGPISVAMDEFIGMHGDYNAPLTVPFDSGMGGATISTFCHHYPMFDTTNNLSLLTFIEYGGFVIAFPGDLEKKAWLEHLKNDAVRAKLARTTILMASHHGRENGFCEEVFQYGGARLCMPMAVVVSDKCVKYGTQETVPQYQAYVQRNGVSVNGQVRNRRVLTTRRDGAITFDVNSNGGFNVFTTK